MPRQARLDAPGTLHHVIVRGIEKRRIVDDDEDRKRLVDRMGAVAGETGTWIYAWALMPNHLHILVRSGPAGISRYMRRVLTGYAVVYNLRHRRHGHLFQNRFKSIVCEEDSYFMELVRYIHLNPVRARLVGSLGELDRYPWSGHSVLMGRSRRPWQDVDETLSFFGGGRRKAVEAYRRYIEEGFSQGSRPDLVGGGLVRSMGGWSAVLSLRRSGEKATADERVLGSGRFVERVIREAGEREKRLLAGRSKEVRGLVEAACRSAKVSIKELRAGSRRTGVSRLRNQLACRIVEEVGLSLADTARELGVSTSAICRSLSR